MSYNPDWYNHESFRTKLKTLYESRYQELPKHKRRQAFVNDFNKKYYKDENSEIIKHNKNDKEGDGKSISTSVNKWLSQNQPDIPTIHNLIKICDILDCDIDYFLTEQTEFKKEIENASEVTGLSTENIEKICNWTDDIKDMFESLINHNDFEELLMQLLIYCYSHYMRESSNSIEIGKYQYVQDTHYMKSMRKFPVTDLFSSIIQDLYNDNEPLSRSEREKKILTEMMLIASSEHKDETIKEKEIRIHQFELRNVLHSKSKFTECYPNIINDLTKEFDTLIAQEIANENHSRKDEFMTLDNLETEKILFTKKTTT